MPRTFQKIIIYPLVVVVLILTTSVAYCQQTLVIEDFTPGQIQFSAFNSFEHKLLVLSFTQKDKAPFSCDANRYVFYDYGQEDYFELNAGILKINGDYSKVLFTKIHSLGSSPLNGNAQWTARIHQLVEILNISATTLETGKSISTDRTKICWQQPSLYDFSTQTYTSLHFLAANSCSNSWCGDIYWVDNTLAQFWIQLTPKQFHLIRLNSATLTHSYKETINQTLNRPYNLTNAPRKNLIDDRNKKQGEFSINSSKGKTKQLKWWTKANGKVTVRLTREKSDDPAALRMAQKIKGLRESRKPMDAHRLLKFADWLSPNNKELKLEKLMTFASLLLADNLLQSLENDFSLMERLNACSHLNATPSMQVFMKQGTFKEKYTKLCP